MQWRSQEKCSGGGPRFEGKSYKGSLGMGVSKEAEPPCRGPRAEPLVGDRGQIPGANPGGKSQGQIPGQSPRKIFEKFMKIYFRK